MKHGKRYAEVAKKVDRTKLYEPEEAIALAKETAVVLPAGIGKKVRVLVFAKGAKLDEAQEAGADFVGGQELLPKIQNEGWLDFDVVVATPDMMSVVGRLGRILGPKGLMPNPKAKSNIIHCPIGKASFTKEQLMENYDALMAAIVKAKPAAVKGQYLKSISIATSMGPGVKVIANRY